MFTLLLHHDLVISSHVYIYIIYRHSYRRGNMYYKRTLSCSIKQ